MTREAQFEFLGPCVKIMRIRWAFWWSELKGVCMDRRDFLKLSGLALVGLGLRGLPALAAPATIALPSSLGRIINWRQAIRKSADPKASIVAWKNRDEIIPLWDAVEGKAPWPSNPIWYQTDDGFVHSGYVQPVENAIQASPVAPVPEPGIWTQVCVPVTRYSWEPGGAPVGLKMYYGTVYRVVGAAQDLDGRWWYRIQYGMTYSPGPYVLAETLRYITPEELLPISPGRTDKHIVVNLREQTVTCFEGDTPVFSTRISSGSGKNYTPRGDFRVYLKRHTSRMIGGDELTNDKYDLPGVAFPSYFTPSGIAFHGTYWHNDFGRPHSHGCINVSNAAAQWIFQWTDPIVPYTDLGNDGNYQEGTLVQVV